MTSSLTYTGLLHPVSPYNTCVSLWTNRHEAGSERSVTGMGRLSAVSEKRHVSAVTGRRDALISDGWLGSRT